MRRFLRFLSTLVLIFHACAALAAYDHIDKMWEAKQWSKIEKEADRLINKGDPQGSIELGLLAVKGLTKKLNAQEGLELLKTVADNGNAEAQYFYADALDEKPGRNGLVVRRYMTSAALGGFRPSYASAAFCFDGADDLVSTYRFGVLALKLKNYRVLNMLAYKFRKGAGLDGPQPELGWALEKFRYDSLPEDERTQGDAEMLDRFASEIKSPTYAKELLRIANSKGPAAAIAKALPALGSPDDPALVSQSR